MKALDIENVQHQAIETNILLESMKLKVPSPVTILANLKEIESRIEEGYTAKEIVTTLQLPIKHSSFSAAWYRATNIRVTDVPKQRRGRTALLAKGYTEDQVKEIMEATK